MKRNTSDRYRVKTGKVHTMEDLRMEKMRLRLEIMKTEERIHQGYRNLLDALTLKNILSGVVRDVSSTTTVFSKALSIGSALMSGKKKKKHHRHPEDPGPEPV